MSHNPQKGGTLGRDNQLVGPSGTKAALDTIAAGGSVRGSVCYATDEDKYYFVNQSDVLQELGGAESAGKNYCTDFDFNGGSIDFWNTSDASNFTISLDTSSKLIGANSLKLVKAASDQSGDYVSTDTFAVDTAMKSQILDVMFWADLSDANIADDDLVVTVWNVDNDVAVAEGWKQLKAGKGFARFDFQLDQELNYQIRIKQNSTNASAYSAYFDYFVFSPAAPVVNGPVITEWKDWTPTVKATTTDPTLGGAFTFAKYRRNGSNLEIDLFYSQSSSGTAGSGAYYIPLPNGLAPVSGYDINVPNSLLSNASLSLGTGSIIHGLAKVRSDGVGIMLDNSTTATTEWADAGAYNFGLSAFRFSIKASIPIAGWQSNMELSSTYTGRDIGFYAHGITPFTLSSVNSPIVFPTVVSNKALAYDSTTGTFTALESGDFDFTMFAAVTISAGLWAPALYVTKSGAPSVYAYGSIKTTGPVSLEGAWNKVSLSKGDTAKVHVVYYGGAAGTCSNSGTATNAFHFSAKRSNSGTPTFGRQPKYFAHYTSTAGASVSSSGTNLVRATKVVDTNPGWYNTTTGAFTPDRSGVLEFGAGFALATVSSTAAGTLLAITNSGGTSIETFGGQQIANGWAQNAKGSGSIYVEKGQIYYIKGISATTAAEVTGSPSSNYIWFMMD